MEKSFRGGNAVQSVLTQSGFLPDLQKGVDNHFTLAERVYDGDIGCGVASSKANISLTKVRLTIKNSGFNHKAEEMSWKYGQPFGDGGQVTLWHTKQNPSYSEVIVGWEGGSMGLHVEELKYDHTENIIFKFYPLAKEVTPWIQVYSNHSFEYAF